MRVTAPQLRTVLLAQAIEQGDTTRSLVTGPEREEATRTAVAAAYKRGIQRVGAADVVLERADRIVQHASGRDAAVAALRQPGAGWRWLAPGLPLLALVMGLVIDRIANAHRVDLLSPPLLIVVAWNLCVYLLIVWRALRPATPGPAWQGLQSITSRLGAGRGRRAATRVVADFQTQWWARTAGLQAERAARVLHLCAAAWGAGIALSLVLRGLVVRYQFGWESTFLDATQVHAIVSVLFWPVHAVLATLFGLAPFTLQEIAATQDFAGEGAGGSRWVAMYAGLLMLVVVLPRLALAGWARWREVRWQGDLDLNDAQFDALRASLPGDLVIGLHGPLAEVLMGAGLQTAHGDRLQFGDAREPVDAVLAWTIEAPPTAWQSAPVVALRWEAFGASWVLEPTLFDRLATALPAQQHALRRLRAAWGERNEQRFRQSLDALARHLIACAEAAASPPAGDAASLHARYLQQLNHLDATLRALHGQAPAPMPPAEDGASAGPTLLPANRRASATALAVGTSAGAAAGAAAGAKAGALIDVGTGGLTLGAGTALGALLGGTTAWVLRSWQKKESGGPADEWLRHVAEAACTHYLVIAHAQRVPTADAPRLAERWRAEVTGTVAAHSPALLAALERPGDDDTVQNLQALLHTMLGGILKRSFGAEDATGPSGATAPEHGA